MKILFAMAGEKGHHVGTFGLARRLTERGHSIAYLSLPPMAEPVRQAGFAFTALPLPDRFEDFLAFVGGPGLDGLLEDLAPDLLLCDPLVWYVALRAYRRRIRTVNLAIVLTYHENDRVAPVTMGLRPRWGPAVRALWKWQWLQFFFTRRLASRWLGWFRAPHRMHHLLDTFLELARRADYPLLPGRTYHRSEVGPYLALPEIVLCPRAFQLPEARQDERIYLGDFLDRKRDEGQDELPEGPYVLCALGTAAHFYPHSRRFYRAVREAARLRPQWRFVALGEAAPSTLPNLITRAWGPQLRLLERARAMVTHGGINSVLECIQREVPMLVVPGLRDQPGNAVRVRAHGLGHRLSMRTITGPGLLAALDRLLADRNVPTALSRMKTRIAEEPGLEQAIAYLER